MSFALIIVDTSRLNLFGYGGEEAGEYEVNVKNLFARKYQQTAQIFCFSLVKWPGRKPSTLGCSNENSRKWDRRREKAIASCKDCPSPDYMQLSSMIIYLSEIVGSVSK
jgi:hypothetical protein